MVFQHHTRRGVVLTGLLAALLWIGQVAADGYRQIGDTEHAGRAESGVTLIFESARWGTGRASDAERPADPFALPAPEASVTLRNSGSGIESDPPAASFSLQTLAQQRIRAPPPGVNVI